MGAAAMRKIVKVGLVALLASLRVAAPVEAQSYDDAVEAAQSGEYAKALILLHPLADRGDARGQFYLGTVYGNGLGVPQDHAEAVAQADSQAERAPSKMSAGV